MESKGESDHCLEILESLEILEILETSPVKRSFLLAKTCPKSGKTIITSHDVLERDVISSGQICCSKSQRVFTLGDGCWLPMWIFGIIATGLPQRGGQPKYVRGRASGATVCSGHVLRVFPYLTIETRLCDTCPNQFGYISDTYHCAPALCLEAVPEGAVPPL